MYMTIDVVLMISLIVFAIIIELTDHQVDKKNFYERCHETKDEACKDILTYKLCKDCPYRIKTRSI